MKLVMTLLVRDEQDIIGEHLDFHLAQGVNQVIVTDNGSEDATLDILREYETRGEVSVIHEPSDEHREGEVMEELQRGYKLGDRLLRPAMVKVAKRS